MAKRMSCAASGKEDVVVFYVTSYVRVLDWLCHFEKLYKCLSIFLLLHNQ